MQTLLIAHADQTHREFLIDKGLRDAREHYATLFAAQLDPHALDNATIARLQRVSADSLARCDVYEQQLRRWRSQRLTYAQQHELARLDLATRELRLMLTETLALADELASICTERQRSTADAELGPSTRCARSLHADNRAANPRPSGLSATLAGDHDAGALNLRRPLARPPGARSGRRGDALPQAALRWRAHNLPRVTRRRRQAPAAAGLVCARR